MKSVLFCPAKINLYLEVHDKRSDGYHELGTLFQALDIGDELSAQPAEGFSLSGAEEVTPDPESNLILKAARRLLAFAAEKAESPVPKHAGLHFELKKTLPAGAGLGGGSTNAAAALRLTNELLGLEIPESELMQVAKSLGADVPFFLHGGTAFGEGIGEVLKAAPEPFPFHVVVATPKAHVSTAWAYQNLNAERQRQWGKFKALYHIYCEDPRFYRTLRNDFEAPMLSHFPPIAAMHQALTQFEPIKVMLSGSGASLFALFESQAQAQSALLAISPEARFSALTHFTP
jgi:4-diphosphocytidyl-2-C-methyl-D-erythritol kinase